MTLSIAHLYPASGSVVLVLCGRLDHATAPELRTAIIVEAGRLPRPRSIVVDLTDVGHVDRTGVGSLVVGNRFCAVLGVNLTVRGPTPLIRGLIDRSTGDQPEPASTGDAACLDRRRQPRRAARKQCRPVRPRIALAPPGRPPGDDRPRRGR